ncbi:MAG: hypothetical protein Q8N83_11940 [Ignavibacteria bacterium]|nr:hypothetical protein [Ignavibacteria bacterium]
MINSIKRILPYIVSPSLFIAGFFVGIVGNQLSDYVPFELSLLAIVLFGGIGLLYYYLVVKNPEPNFDISALKDETAQNKEARKGLVVFLPLYKNFQPTKKFTDEVLKNYLKEGDYNSLDLPNTAATNFGHAINAIKAHKSKLEHVWVVTTRAPLQANAVTSLEYMPVFKKFIKEEIDIEKKIELHFGKEYSIDITETSQISKKTFELVRDIYKEAKKDFKLNSNEIIVDVTGGFVAMSVGAVLASLAKDQDVQVIGSEYDRITGNPIGGDKSYPVKIGYAPHLVKD